MKKYRLKKEAVPFFEDKLATKIFDLEVWKTYNVDNKALEEVECARIEYGIKTSKNSSSLCGWDEKGTELHFTIVFPSMKYHEYNIFSKGKMVRELMNRLQNETNRFVENFYNGEV